VFTTVPAGHKNLRLPVPAWVQLLREFAIGKRFRFIAYFQSQ